MRLPINYIVNTKEVQVATTFITVLGKRYFCALERNYLRIRSSSNINLDINFSFGGESYYENYTVIAGKYVYIEINDYLRAVGNGNFTIEVTINGTVYSNTIFTQQMRYWDGLYDSLDGRTNFGIDYPSKFYIPSLYEINTYDFYIPYDYKSIYTQESFPFGGKTFGSVSLLDYGDFGIGSEFIYYLYLSSGDLTPFRYKFSLSTLQEFYTCLSTDVIKKEVLLTWVGMYGLKKSWTFHVDEEHEITADTLTLYDISNPYRINKNAVRELVLTFPNADYITQKYLSDLFISSDVQAKEINILNPRLGYVDTTCNVKNTDFVVTEKKRDITFTIQIATYDTF